MHYSIAVNFKNDVPLTMQDRIQLERAAERMFQGMQQGLPTIKMATNVEVYVRENKDRRF